MQQPLFVRARWLHASEHARRAACLHKTPANAHVPYCLPRPPAAAVSGAEPGELPANGAAAFSAIAAAYAQAAAAAVAAAAAASSGARLAPASLPPPGAPAAMSVLGGPLTPAATAAAQQAAVQAEQLALAQSAQQVELWCQQQQAAAFLRHAYASGALPGGAAGAAELAALSQTAGWGPAAGECDGCCWACSACWAFLSQARRSGWLAGQHVPVSLAVHGSAPVCAAGSCCRPDADASGPRPRAAEPRAAAAVPAADHAAHPGKRRACSRQSLSCTDAVGCIPGVGSACCPMCSLSS